MVRSVDFYTNKLGFDIVMASPEVDTPEGRFSHWVLLRSGPIDLMLNTAHDSGERPESPDERRLMAHGDTSFYIACPDLDGVYVALRQAGLDVEPPSRAAYGLRRFSVRDPDNFELVFQGDGRGPPGGVGAYPCGG
jgi:catechol 2,3-dioxygenase-like lactoylglutathione lyase family enzyme